MTSKAENGDAIQADRDAAKALLDRLHIREHETGSFRSWDETVQAFARHRLSSRPTQGSELREALEKIASLDPSGAPGSFLHAFSQAQALAKTALAATLSDQPLREALEAYMSFGAEVAGTCLGLAMSTDHPAPDEALMGLYEKSNTLAPRARHALSSTSSPVPDGEGWQPIETAPRDGKYHWIGRAGEFPFADFMRWAGKRWEFNDGSYVTDEHGPLIYYPLPAPPAALKDREG